MLTPDCVSAGLLGHEPVEEVSEVNMRQETNRKPKCGDGVAPGHAKQFYWLGLLPGPAWHPRNEAES